MKEPGSTKNFKLQDKKREPQKMCTWSLLVLILNFDGAL